MSAATPAADVRDDAATAVVHRVPLTVLSSGAALAVSLVALAALGDGDALGYAAMAIMLVAAAEDLWTRRLRNAFVGPALVIALAADPAVTTGIAAVICVTPFLAMALWKPGSMGMGDVKFAAPAGALAGLQLLGALLVAIGLIGGVLAMIAFVRHGREATLAYGPAIALATLWVAFFV